MSDLYDRIEAYADQLHEECDIVIIAVVGKEGQGAHIALSTRGSIFEASGFAQAVAAHLNEEIVDGFQQ